MDHIDRHHIITVAGAIDLVFPLFTPLGETQWVEGWNPEFLHPTSGETQADMVFRTGHGAEETLWACIDWIPSAHQVRYARVTPGSRFGFVGVGCRAIGAGVTDVSVRYTFTALTADGRAYLAALTEPAFAKMIDGWRERINQWLQDQSVRI